MSEPRIVPEKSYMKRRSGRKCSQCINFFAPPFEGDYLTKPGFCRALGIGVRGWDKRAENCGQFRHR
jgi:hypothetical protein